MTTQKKFLHITNGDFAADLIRRSTCSGSVLPLREVLYDGPVPGNLSYADLSQVRAKYLSEQNYGDYAEILGNFISQQTQLENFRHFDEIVLWFEHDLYDQLQLIQMLDWFSRQALSNTKLTLLCIGEFPGIIPFYGLGQLTPSQIDEIFSKRQPVTDEQLELGKKAWMSFTNPRPDKLEKLLTEDLSSLPYLKNALTRHLQEFPSAENGLSRTEQFILVSIKQHVNDLAVIFQQLPVDEGKLFMGLSDLYFWIIVKRMADGKHPLIRLVSSRDLNTKHSISLSEISASLTELGQDVLANNTDWVAVNGIDRWLGGVHLTSEQCWRWHETKQHML